MKTQSLAYLLLGATAVTALAVGWAIRSPQDSTRGAGTASSRPAIAATQVGAVPESGGLRARDDHGVQGQNARGNPADLREVMRQYALEVNLDKRGALLAILQSEPNDEVKRFALRQAESTDPVIRREGLGLLSAFPLDDGEVRDVLVGQIGEEHDPAMLKALVEMLAPTMVATEDAAPLVEQLVRLRKHPDPEVRAASVLQSSQWDRGGDIESTLHQAMLDPDSRVRQAAIAGITSERLRSDRLKDVLLEAAYDAHTSAEERSAAIFALEGFALNRAEYELFRQAGERVRSDEEPGVHSH